MSNTIYGSSAIGTSSGGITELILNQKNYVKHSSFIKPCLSFKLRKLAKDVLLLGQKIKPLMALQFLMFKKTSLQQISTSYFCANMIQNLIGLWLIKILAAQMSNCSIARLTCLANLGKSLIFNSKKRKTGAKKTRCIYNFSEWGR